jgi:two-component system, LytTR family, sensor kinase
VVVENTLRPRPGTDAGTGVGLRNLAERYRLASHRDIDVSSSPESFRVRLPLLAA